MLEQGFCDAYNARDLDALTALLADEATAELVGSDFPAEHGPAAIAAGSLTHLLEGALHAEVTQPRPAASSPSAARTAPSTASPPSRRPADASPACATTPAGTTRPSWKRWPAASRGGDRGAVARE